MIEFAAASGPRLMLDETSVLDIGGCIVDGVDIAPKRAIPDDGDARIDHSLEGFLFTCGPDHIRHRQPIPGRDDGKVYPLHGSASGHTAKVLWTKFENGNAECRADIDITTVEGLPQRIERLWRIDGATGEVRLEDRVVNMSDRTVPTFLMYHMNTGGKWLDEGTRLEGQMLENGVSPGRSARSRAASSASRRRRRRRASQRSASDRSPQSAAGRCVCASAPTRCPICRSGGTRRRPPISSVSSRFRIAGYRATSFRPLVSSTCWRPARAEAMR